MRSPDLAIVVISLLFAPITSAQGIDSDVESALVSGPTYITLVCDQGSCSGYTLEVISDLIQPLKIVFRGLAMLREH